MNQRRHKNEETPTAATVEASNQAQTLTKGTDMSNSSTVSPISNVHTSTLPVIAGHEIAIDEHGRFNLNAIHKASGSENRKRPSMWLQNKQAKELVDELQSKCTDMGIKDSESRNSCFDVISTRRGGNGGTFAHELLAVSYAGWISPKFQLQVNQVFLDYRMGKLHCQNNNTASALLTEDHKLSVRDAVASRVYDNVSEKHRPKAFKRIYSHIQHSLRVSSYKAIPDDRFEDALNAVYQAPLEGEWIEAKPKRLEIHYPVSQWRKENPQFEQFQSNLPSNQLRVNHDMLLRKDAPAQSSSPTVALLNQLQGNGYNVDACIAEVNGLFSATSDMDAFLRGFQRGIGSVLSDTATITYHS